MSYLAKAMKVAIPTGKKGVEQAEWQFNSVEIPRLDGKSVDVWMVGTRLDKPGTFQFWFVRTQDKDEPRTD